MISDIYNDRFNSTLFSNLPQIFNQFLSVLFSSWCTVGYELHIPNQGNDKPAIKGNGIMLKLLDRIIIC